jgi:hypothetical protein
MHALVLSIPTGDSHSPCRTLDRSTLPPCYLPLLHMIPAIPISSSDPRCLHVGDGTQVGDVQTVRRTVPPDMFNPHQSHAPVFSTRKYGLHPL